MPRSGKPAQNQIAVQLDRVTQKPDALRLHFDQNLMADISRPEFEVYKLNREWVIEFPSTQLRVL